MKWKNRTSILSDEIARLEALEAHEVLNVNCDATIEEIKAAFRNLSKIYHPDKSDPFLRNHNEKVMKIINKSYQKLMKVSD